MSEDVIANGDAPSPTLSPASPSLSPASPTLSPVLVSHQDANADIARSPLRLPQGQEGKVEAKSEQEIWAEGAGLQVSAWSECDLMYEGFCCFGFVLCSVTLQGEYLSHSLASILSTLSMMCEYLMFTVCMCGVYTNNHTCWWFVCKSLESGVSLRILSSEL